MKAKKTTKKTVKELNRKIDEFDKGQERINEINASLSGRNHGEAVDFAMRFSVSQDLRKMIQVLSQIQEQPQVFKQKTEFDTTNSIAMMDGERNLFRKFLTVMNAASEGDRMKVEQMINRISM